jgi:hypothetical protein
MKECGVQANREIFIQAQAESITGPEREAFGRILVNFIAQADKYTIQSKKAV